MMRIWDLNKKSGLHPASGVLLVAEPYLQDPGFARSVILLCEHGENGTLGFVLNRPSINSVNMLLPELRFPGVHIYDGGPVRTDSLQILHCLPEHLGGEEVLPGVFWGATYDELAKLYHSKIEIAPSLIRLFRGYSGWDVGQLETELEQGAWITAPGNREIIFNEDSNKVWSLSLSSLGKDYAFMANLPVDPILN